MSGTAIKKLILTICLLPCVVALGQNEQRPDRGTIHGTVLDQSGKPARGIRLKAHPLGGILTTALPDAKTDDDGNFRFVNLPWWGRYTIYADDLDAGYSIFATRWQSSEKLQEVTISPESPEAVFDFQLPPPAGFLQFHLTNSGTGKPISGVEVEVRFADTPDKIQFSIGCASDRPILVPSDRDLIIHVTSWGFYEWNGSVGKGKLFRVPPGAHFNLDVQLDPSPDSAK